MSNEDTNRQGESDGVTGWVRRTVRQLVPSLEAADEREWSSSSGGTGTGKPSVSKARKPTPRAMTDEERIVRYLRPHGGQMRQGELVDCTEWSKSKMSRLLSDMEGEGTINRTQIGREKIVALPGHEPEAVRSSFDTPKRPGDDARARSK